MARSENVKAGVAAGLFKITIMCVYLKTSSHFQFKPIEMISA